MLRTNVKIGLICPTTTTVGRLTCITNTTDFVLPQVTAAEVVTSVLSHKIGFVARFGKYFCAMWFDERPV